MSSPINHNPPGDDEDADESARIGEAASCDDREFETVAKLSELEEGRPLLVFIAGRPIGLFRRGEQVFALYNRCPHAGAPLTRGTVDDDCVSCPMHHWQFRLADGRRPDALDRPGVRAYQVQIVGDEIRVGGPLIAET